MSQEEKKQQEKKKPQQPKQETQEDKQKNTSRRDRLQEIEKDIQKVWVDTKIYETNPDLTKKKFFITFPYPYANGRLHLGHAYSYTKADFTARYKKMLGYNVLLPFGFHVTGMPISAAAQKLTRELEGMQQLGQEDQQPTGQFKTMLSMGITKEEIHNFKDPYYWVHYFPPLGKEDLTRFGAPIDWRRTFITSDANPYYNSFIEWQFQKLREGGYLRFGKRPSIYSITDKQQCADHERREGETLNPQEYTLIKIRIIEPELVSPLLKDRQVYMVAATLRPETMYGQTNCFVLRTGTYGVYEMKNNELYVCSERSVRNMAYQNQTRIDEKIECVCQVQGDQLIGLKLKAPLAQYDVVYALPMDSIKMDKGTGVVTSVPSDAPDDWATLRDLQKKPDYYKIQKEWAQFDPVRIIDVPKYGDLSALKACEDFQVKSSKDHENIKKAKDEVYLLGFYEGTMLIGDHKGLKVKDAKPLVKKFMIEQNLAATYYEPEGMVVSRSGDECIVALLDQWYECYDDPSWKDAVRGHIQNHLQTFRPEVQQAFLETVDWLGQWGCSRSFGLGTRLPWDKQYLIESLSDSTLYFAYYTVVHYLQSNFDGSKRGTLDIDFKDLNVATWDYIFLNGEYDPTKIQIPREKLDIMRGEFNYWYPLDLRVSAKDLVKNHLTMALFNHAAVFKNFPEKWPRAYFCNGYILVDGDKMSKQLGNFKTLNDLIKEAGADVTRFGCAQAGDNLDDANFEYSNCNANILKISNLLQYFERAFSSLPNFRQKAQDVNIAFFDKVFENQIKFYLYESLKAYNEMRFRDVIKNGFFNLQGAKDEYLLLTHAEGPNKDLILQYLETQLIVMHPIIPHVTEYCYKTFFGKSLSDYRFPDSPTFLQELYKDIAHQTLKEYKYFTDLMRQIRVSYDKFRNTKKNKDKETELNKIIIITAKDFSDWQKEVLVLLNSGQISENGVPAFDWKATLSVVGKPEQIKQKQLQFGNYVLGEYKTRGQAAIDLNINIDEVALIERFKDNILKEFKVKEVQVVDHIQAQEGNNKAYQTASQTCQPQKPSLIFE